MYRSKKYVDEIAHQKRTGSRFACVDGSSNARTVLWKTSGVLNNNHGIISLAYKSCSEPLRRHLCVMNVTSCLLCFAGRPVTVISLDVNAMWWWKSAASCHHTADAASSVCHHVSPRPCLQWRKGCRAACSDVIAAVQPAMTSRVLCSLHSDVRSTAQPAVTSPAPCSLQWRHWCRAACSDVTGGVQPAVTSLVPCSLQWRHRCRAASSDSTGAMQLAVTSRVPRSLQWRHQCRAACSDVSRRWQLEKNTPWRVGRAALRHCATPQRVERGR